MTKVIPVLILAVGLVGTAPATQVLPTIPNGIRVRPCPDQPWQFETPSFAALGGARAFEGRYEGGVYRVEIPNDWNGELLLYVHGNRSSTGPEGSILRAPLAPGSGTGSVKWRQHLVENGFAWAASSFRCNGFVPGIGLIDTLALIDVFTQTNGGRKASHVYLAGASQGGFSVLQGLEYLPGIFAGALAMCPDNGSLGDFFVSVRAAAEFIGGIQIAGAEPTVFRETITATFGQPPVYTSRGRQLASVQIHLSGGPRPFAVEGLNLRFVPNIVTPSRTGSNVRVQYSINEALGMSAATLNAGVRRTPGDQSLRGPDAPIDTIPFDGRIQEPLLTLHGTGDLQIPITVQRSIRRAVAALGKEQWLVQRIMRIPGHCGFSDAEQIRAFDDLVTWVRKGVRPDGDDVLQDFQNAGAKFTDPLRPGDPGDVDIVP